MTLIKPSDALPKFTMQTGWWRHPSWAGVSLGAIGLQTEGISYCYEHMTDGRLPKGADNIAVALGVKLSDCRKGMKELIARKKWIERGDHTEIVDYLDHNPSRDEIKADRKKRRDASAKANHRRWHVEEPDPTCALCVAESHTDSDPVSDSDADGSPEGNGAHDGARTPDGDNGDNGEYVDTSPPTPPEGGRRSLRSEGQSPRQLAAKREAKEIQERIDNCETCGDKSWTCDRCDRLSRRASELGAAV